MRKPFDFSYDGVDGILIANEYDSYWQNKKPEMKFRHIKALDFIQKENDIQSILDLGCGDGFFSEILHKRSYDVTAVDFSGVAIDKTDGKPLPFEYKSFDAVLLLDVIEHLHQPESVIMDACSIGKCVIISAPNFVHYRSRLEVLLGDSPAIMRNKKGHIQFITLPRFESFVGSIGMQIEEMKFDGLQRESYPTGVLVEKFPNLFASSFIAKIKKK